jgi:CelD/BcsL family acetyltransferase involved in cellulose biosynthesis
MRNRNRRLEKLGTIALETIAEEEGLPGALFDAFRIEAAAWKGEAHTAIHSDAALAQFYSQLAHVGASRGWLRLHFLTLDGRRIAVGFSLTYRRKLYVLKAGYDPEFSTYSPFNVLCERLIRRSIEAGLTEFDFLGTDHDWKMRWTPAKRPHYWLYIFSRRLRARFIHWVKFGVIPRWREQAWVRSLIRVVRVRRARMLGLPVPSAGGGQPDSV